MFLLVVKYHSYQSAANLRIYQNIFKGSPSKLLSQKMHFQNCSLKITFSLRQKIASSKKKKKKKFQNC